MVERKVGTSAMSMMAINATEWYSAEWARKKLSGEWEDSFTPDEEFKVKDSLRFC